MPRGSTPDGPMLSGSMRRCAREPCAVPSASSAWSPCVRFALRKTYSIPPKHARSNFGCWSFLPFPQVSRNSTFKTIRNTSNKGSKAAVEALNSDDVVGIA